METLSTKESPENSVVSHQLVYNPNKPWLAIPGATSEQELDWLHMNAYDKNKIYEIGSFLGRSTVALLESGSPVIAVDDFFGNREDKMTAGYRKTIYDQFLANTKAYKNLRILKLDHEDFVPHTDCDMVFIDGSHLYDHVVRDILKFRNHKNILICGHDFSWWNSVRAAVMKLFRGRFQLIGPNLWYVRQ